ncbi:MAG TPA: sulfotransferase [Rhizomicrobium sp.]|jgi:tetratricopeptide (TPR) repeat protein|nr:sulfotransferase [Rhizomicrobium sp.]
MMEKDKEVDLELGGILWPDIAGVAELLPTAPAEAERQARAVLALLPGQPHALRILVDALRVQGNIDGARSALESMAKDFPELAVVHQELGTLLGELGDGEAAARALSRAVELEPRHPAAWRSLGDELAALGDKPAAAGAYAKHFESSILDLKMIEHMLARGPEKDETAANMLREFLKIYPTDVFTIHQMGRTYMQVGLFEPAEQLFARALALAPDFADAGRDYRIVLYRQSKWQAASAELDRLLKDEPENAEYRFAKATALLQLGDYATAVGLFEALVRDHPDVARPWAGYANALRSLRRTEESIAAFRKCISLDPGIGAAWWSLVDLTGPQISDSDLHTMQRQLARAELSHENRTYLHFALGEALDARQQYEQAFEHLREANALRRKELPYDANEMTRAIKRVKRQFTEDFFRARQGEGCVAEDPIFIVGLTRSGSTLIEQVLSSHPAIEGAGELPSLALIATRVQMKHKSKSPSERDDGPALAEEDLRALGEEYLEASRIYRRLGRPFFTDKLPGNFHHLALICAALPHAKIIDVRRHPLACCFSNYKQQFPWGQAQTYDLADMGRYYRDYVELMAHFDAVLPGRIHRVFYEDMVRDTETEARRLFDYCGLPFEPASLRFYESERVVFTLSAEQVRRPIFTRANEQWRNYERWLGPLKAALGELPDIYPAVPDRV